MNDPRIARAVHQGGYADVLLRPTMVSTKNAGAHPAGATLSTDFEICAGESFNRVLLSGRSLVFSYPTVDTQQSSVRTAWQRRRLQDPLAGQPGAGRGPHRRGEAGGQPPELQMQLGSLQSPHNPMKGASEHFHFLSVLAGTYDDTVRNIDIGRMGCTTDCQLSHRACPRCR